MKQTLLEKDFKEYHKPICFECNLRERGCLLEKGVECLGPVTYGSCSVMCPLDNYPCVGCRGPYEDANFEAFFKLLESKGVPKDKIFSHLNRFAGIKFQRAMQKQREELEERDEHACFDIFCHVSKDKLKKTGSNCWGQ